MQQSQAALDVAVCLDGHGLVAKLRRKQPVQRLFRKAPEIACAIPVLRADFRDTGRRQQQGPAGLQKSEQASDRNSYIID